MPLFLFERNVAEKLKDSLGEAGEIHEIYGQEHIRWLISFLGVDQKKIYCLYEITLADAIREAADRAGIPADLIIEVNEANIPREAMHKLRLDRKG